MKRIALVLVLGAVSAFASADLIPWNLSSGNFSQDWSSAAISVNDDWSGVSAITGYNGADNSTTASPQNPSTYLIDAPNTAVNVIANQTNPNTLSSGGVAEFDTLTNKTVALQGSGAADLPMLRIVMNAVGRTNVTISYNLRDIDGSTDNSVQPVALQYRLASSGSWTNVASAFVADASSGPSLATLVTPVSATNAAWANASVLEFRIMTGNAQGNDEWIGVDDIRVTSTALVPEPTSMAALGLGIAALIRRRRK